MSINLRAQQYGKVFGDWVIRDLIGQGSGGKTAVFRLTRNKLTYEETSVMKVVSIIDETGNYSDMSEEYKEAYLQRKEELCSKAEDEVRLMYSLRGNGNIVNYLDWTCSDWEDGTAFGTDLLIRMEFLDNLGARMKKGYVSPKEIIHIGMDICNALKLCHKENIIHRDIKPDNIFIGRVGNYLLGDFGISKMVEENQNAATMTGTKAYAAPEQFTSSYDYRIDIYSLGLTLYELANGNKLPFAKSSYATFEEIQMRLNGRPIPLPANVDEELGQIIVKACEFDAEKRYQNVEAMYVALLKYEICMQRKNGEDVTYTEEVNVDADSLYRTEPAMEMVDLYATELALSADTQDNQYEEESSNKAILEEELQKARLEEQEKEIVPVVEVKELLNDYDEIADAYQAQGKNNKADIWRKRNINLKDMDMSWYRK